MSEWKEYSRIGYVEMRPYVPGEDLDGISVSITDTPRKGGMIARDPKNHADQWYVSQEFFATNYYIRVLPVLPHDTAGPQRLFNVKLVEHYRGHWLRRIVCLYMGHRTKQVSAETPTRRICTRCGRDTEVVCE